MTASLSGVMQRVSAALDLAQAATTFLREAEETAREAASLLTAIGRDSSHEADYQAASASWITTADETERLRRTLTDAQEALNRYLANLQGLTAPPPVSAGNPVTTVQSASGDHYPAEAWWGTPLIERYSPPGGNVPVHGFARAKGGSEQALPFRPGEPYWARRATERAQKLRAPRKFWDAKIIHHVEFETATWMVEFSITEAELIINRTPCGYRKDLEGERKGCHQYLQAFLPSGSSLHIYGTDENGRRSFIATYRGSAK